MTQLWDWDYTARIVRSSVLRDWYSTPSSYREHIKFLYREIIHLPQRWDSIASSYKLVIQLLHTMITQLLNTEVTMLFHTASYKERSYSFSWVRSYDLYNSEILHCYTMLGLLGYLWTAIVSALVILWFLLGQKKNDHKERNDRNAYRNQ